MRQHDSALQEVDVVIDHRGKIQCSGDNARRLVANFNAHALRAGKNVLSTKEVQRATRAAEFFATRNSSGLRSECINGEFLVTERSSVVRLVMHVCAVQTTIHARQFIVHIADLEITELAEIVVLA